MKKLLKTPLAIALTSLLALPAFGEIYIGGNIGNAEHKYIDDDSTSIGLTGGYRLNENFSLELSYTDFGDLSEYDSFDGFTEKFDIDSLNFSIVGAFPVTDVLSVYAKLGHHEWDYAVVENGTKVISLDGGDFSYGLGVAWNINENIDIKLGFDHYDLKSGSEKTDIGNVNLGLTYSF